VRLNPQTHRIWPIPTAGPMTSLAKRRRVMRVPTQILCLFLFLFSTKVELNQRVRVSDIQAKDVTFQVETGVGTCWTRVRQSRRVESVITTLMSCRAFACSSLLLFGRFVCSKLASQQLDLALQYTPHTPTLLREAHAHQHVASC
jgi:hypothetical protein